MKKTKAFLCALSLSLAFSPIGANFASAENPHAHSKGVTLNHDNGPHDFSFKHEGIDYKVKSVHDDKFITTTIQDDKGYQEFETNKSNGYVSVSSDYLSEEEIKDLEKSTNSMVVEVDGKEINGFVTKGHAPTPTNNNQVQTETIGIQAIKGSWVWSKWSNLTVTVEGKMTVAAITAYLLNLIPYVGSLAALFAGLMVTWNMKVGYFKRRGATAADTDPNYLWSKIQLNLYTNSSRTTLVKSETGEPYRVRVY